MATGAATAGAAIGIFMLFFFIIWIVVIILGILGLIFWIFMIIDVVKRQFKNDNDRIIWILVVVLTGWIGAIVYYFVNSKGETCPAYEDREPQADSFRKITGNYFTTHTLANNYLTKLLKK